jgi:glycosyltransferase involved in cell wall biosynthesis
MQLVHVVPHVGFEAAGPSYSVPRLCQALAARGHAVEMSCLGAGLSIAGVAIDVHPSWPVLRGFAISHSHPRALAQKACRVDVIHNHSLWSMVNVASGFAGTGGRALFVCSPRGTLSSWALRRSRWRKRMIWPMQKRALTRAGLLHATSVEELADIRALGLRAPVAVIPNGIDLPPAVARTGESDGRRLLFLGRIHPVKGLERLLAAWEMLQGRHPGWRLDIHGPGEEGYVAELRASAARRKLDRVAFHGAVYGEGKSHVFRTADLFVLPTHSENFGMAVAEALAHGVPAVVTRGAPWSGLEVEGAGWWTEQDVPAIAAALDAAMALPPSALQAMGRRGRAWMERDFAWDPLAERMALAYAFAMGKAPRPDWVDA